jgi:hypothetical protein
MSSPKKEDEQDERAQWFRFSRAVLEVLQPGMRALFKQRFDSRFGAIGFTCTDDAAFGDVFVNGRLGAPVSLPGTISVRQNQCVGYTTHDWPGAGVAKDSRISLVDGIQAHVMTVSRFGAPPTPAAVPFKVTFVEKYPGPDTATASADLVTHVVPPAERGDNKPIDPPILRKYENGNTNDWDLTAFKMALLGLKSQLMHPLQTQEFHKTVTTCAVPADYVVAATNLRNSEFAHRATVRMPVDRYRIASDGSPCFRRP